MPVGRQTHPILLGCDQAGFEVGRPIRQAAKQGAVIGDVIGKGRKVLEITSGRGEGARNFPGFADTGEPDLRAWRRRGRGAQVGRKQDRPPKRGDQLRIRLGEVRGEKDQHRVSTRQTRPERLAHRPRRENPPVAERPFLISSLAVDDQDGERLADGRVLEAIIHDDDLGACRSGRDRAGAPIAGHPDWEIAGQHQGLVPDIGAGVRAGVHADRRGEPPAISAG